MAPPTVEKLLAYLDDEMVPPVEGHVAWKWTALVESAWRHFQSTSHALDVRMDTLFREGSITAVRVDYTGCVLLGDDRLPGVSNIPSFAYHGVREYDRLKYGTISLDRQRNRQNLWANGTRALFMTTKKYNAMLADLARQAEERSALREQAQKKERIQKLAALQAVTPDALDILRRLREAIPKLDVMTHMSETTRDIHEEVTISLNTYRKGTLAPLLDILRRGLEGVDAEA